jgi:hypothetical protein
MAAHPDLRPCRMRTLQSRIPRPTCLPASIPSASPSLASVSTSASASMPTSLIGSGRCLYCGDRSCAKRWCVRYRDDLDTGRIRLDTRGRLCLGYSPASVVRMRMGTSQRACVIEAEQRTRKLAPLRAYIKSTVDSGPAPVSAPVPARVPASISSPAAGPALGPASVPFVTPLSLLPTNAVSTSSPSPSPSPIGSLPSPTCSDLAAKHAKFECDHLLPASSILPADTALPSSPHASSMPSSMPNASDTDILIKLKRTHWYWNQLLKLGKSWGITRSHKPRLGPVENSEPLDDDSDHEECFWLPDGVDVGSFSSVSMFASDIGSDHLKRRRRALTKKALLVLTSEFRVTGIPDTGLALLATLYMKP